MVQDRADINLSAARGVANREVSMKRGHGATDFLQFVDGKAIGTIEAKPEGHTLSGVEEQSAKYDRGVPAGLPAWKSPLPRTPARSTAVRFALEQQSVLKPFAESVVGRFGEWMMDKAKAGVIFTPEQLAWLNLIRDHIATTTSMDVEDFDYAPFLQHDGLARHTRFSAQLCPRCWRN